MRKEAKQSKNVNLSSVQGYHQGGHGSENYAFMGFQENLYLTSDRSIKLDEHFNRPDGKPLQGFGLEIESECMGILSDDAYAEVLNNVIFPHFKAGSKTFKLQRDATLCGRSNAEIITQVMTKSRIRNEYQNFKLMWNTYFPAFSIRTDSGAQGCGCGMHVNVSNALFGDTEEQQIEAIRKLYYIVNRHYNVCRALFYRKNSTQWCGQMDYSEARTFGPEQWQYMSSHSNCMNLSHFRAGRIEIRLVGGQKNFACFRNTMESVFHLVERVRTISWKDCDKLEKIFEGCNQYVYDRLTICGLSDETLQAVAETVKREELL